MKNIYQHNIELEPIRINNADKATFSQKLIDLPYRGYEVEELSDGRKIVIRFMTYCVEPSVNATGSITV